MADQDRRTVIAGALLGAGIAASVVDLAVFHLLLHWHHFYDLSTTGVALASDGLFHAFGWFVTVGSLFLLADIRRRGAMSWGRWTGGLLAVMSREVGQAGDRWLASKCGVGSMMIVEVQPAR